MKHLKMRLLAALLLICVLAALTGCGTDSGGYRQVYPPATEATTKAPAETEAPYGTDAPKTEPPETEAVPETEAPAEAPAETEAPSGTHAPKTELPETEAVPETEAPAEAPAETASDSTEASPDDSESGEDRTVAPNEAAEEPTDAEVTFVLNTNTKRYHVPDCKSVSKIKPENRKDFYGTWQEAEDAGYKPCGNCHPNKK